MSEDHIRYDILTQQAMREVLRKVLTDTSKTGLPGEHKFYFTFETHFPGVVLSKRMKDQYPKEMTIVLEHQFWDLEVKQYGFDVSLSFNGKKEKLHIPFAALTGFFDPSVRFGIQFERLDEKGNVQLGPKISSEDRLQPTLHPVEFADPFAEIKNRSTAKDADGNKKSTGKSKASKEKQAAETPQSADGKVVSLDAFRKKQD